MKTDIVIVGGGLAGINLAFFLLNSGLKIVLLEGNKIAEATSGYTTAKVTSLHWLKYEHLRKHFGYEGAKIYGDSNQWAIGELERIVKKEKINCDFHWIASYVFGSNNKELEKIRQEFKVAKEIGLPASFSDSLSQLPIKISGAIKFDNQAYFHPRKYLLKIAEKLTAGGVKIFENSRVKKIIEKNKLQVITNEGSIEAKNIVITSNFPIYDKGFFYSRIIQERSYALAVKLNEPIPDGMFIGMEEESYSFRPHFNGKNSWMIVGGEEHISGKGGDTGKRYTNLEKYAKKHFKIKSIDYRWSAQDSTTLDKVPYIGKMPGTKNIYVSTGFGEWGMTTSFVSAKLISDLIKGSKNNWEKFYSPSRIKPAASAKKAFKLGVVTTQGLIRTVLKQRELNLAKLKSEEGKIVMHKGKKLAVFKDKKGKITALSAICTHMGCLVDWNNAEKSWDCPCHGSRFSKEGKVITSPAVEDLPQYKID